MASSYFQTSFNFSDPFSGKKTCILVGYTVCLRPDICAILVTNFGLHF